MEHTVTSNRGMLIHYLGRAGVPLLNCTKAVEITPRGLRVERNLHPSVPNPYETWHPILPPNIENPLAPKIKEQNEIQELPGDLIVFASGLAADHQLFTDLQSAHHIPEVNVIADAVKPGRVMEAVQAAERLGRAL